MRAFFLVIQRHECDAIEIMLTAHVDWLIMQLDRDVIRQASSDSLLSLENCC